MLRLALREIRNHRRFAGFFVLNLALGLAGFVALDAFEDSISRALAARSQSFLGADIDVTARRTFEPSEIAALDAAAGAQAELSRATVLFSMAGGAERARLAEVYAIDDAYPLYGAVILKDKGPAAKDALRALRDGPGVWIDPALIGQLGLQVGDPLRVGNATFVVQGLVARDAGRATGGFSIAPRIYIALERLAATGLVALGSRIQHRRLYRLPAGVDSEARAVAMRSLVSDPRIQVRSHQEATDQLARVYAAVSDYLGLVSLIAIFLSGLGTAHLFRTHLARRVRDMAILLSLGATRRRAQGVMLSQLVVLASVSAALAIALGILALPLLSMLAAEFLPPDFEARIGWRTVIGVTALAIGGSTLACLPLLARLRRLRPAQLFVEDASHALGSGLVDWIWLVPALALFWVLAIWRTNSVFAGSAFVAVFMASLLLLVVIGWLLLRALSAIPPRRGLALRLAVRELARGRASTLACFVALALCALLSGMAPQMRGALMQELKSPEVDAIPSLFLFDIQPEQVDALVAHVASEATSLQHVSPMVRARLERINGNVTETRTDPELEPEGQRLQTRRYNLTYRRGLTTSEVLREGRDFSGTFDPLGNAVPEMSLEVGFARRLGVGIGDTLEFDVQGVSVAGEVVNLRQVRWNTLQPNFFVLFQPGVLEEAPQTMLASVPQLETVPREALQASLNREFPNVSAIDVTASVARMLDLIAQLRLALVATAALSVAVGLVLVYAVARDQARDRRVETNLLKILGADFGRIRAMTDIEFALLGVLGAFAGGGIGVVASAALARAVLSTPYHVQWLPLLAVGIAIPLTCVVTGRLATRRVLRERPAVLLQDGAQ